MAVWVWERRGVRADKLQQFVTHKYDLKFKKKNKKKSNLLLLTEIGYTVPGSEIKIGVPFGNIST